jgi:hypothetical protein
MIEKICVVVIVFLLLVLLRINYYPRPRIEELYPREKLEDILSPGDLILVATAPRNQELNKFNVRQFMSRTLSGKGEWTHVAVIAKYKGEFYVYDHCLDSDYDISFSHVHPPDNGFVKLQKYIDSFDGYVGFKKLKIPVNEDDILQACIDHNKNTRFAFTLDRDTAIKILKSATGIYKKKISPPIPVGNCVDALVSLYAQVGVDDPAFVKYSSLSTFIDNERVFGPVKHVEPGKQCSERIKKNFYA